LPKRSSFGPGERVDHRVLKKALNEAWRAADPFDRRDVFDEILGGWIRRGQFLFGDSPVSFQPYSIALDLDSGRWRDRACERTGHGLLALAAHTLGLHPAKAAARILFLLHHTAPKPYRPRLGTPGARVLRRQHAKSPQPSRTERGAIDPHAPPPPLPPRAWEVLVPASSVATGLASEERSAGCPREPRGRSQAIAPPTVPEKPVGVDAHPEAPETLGMRAGGCLSHLRRRHSFDGH
jgi:hypothetical protein